MQSQTTTQSKIVLKLHYKEDEEQKDEKKVKWSEDTIDNEHMNKRKSNICCIYCPRRHTPKYDEQYVDTCSSDDANELERSNQSKREHLLKCSKKSSKKCSKMHTH